MTIPVERRCEPGALASEIANANGRLMSLFCAERDGALELSALISLGTRVLHLRARLYGNTYPSVTPLVPAAHWFERELHDLWGVVPAGHPRLEPLIRHDGGGLDGNGAGEPSAHRGPERLRGDGVFVIPYGPVRSGVFESAQFFVQTGGEDVAYCAQRLFFKRRGVERRICELPPALAVLVAERASGTSSVAHALAFSHAVESLCEVEVPGRAQAIRRILAELERLHNHLEVIVRECEDASLSVAQAQFAVLKERLHRLAAALTGNRFMRGVVVPGGVRIELAAAPLERLASELGDWGREFAGTLKVLLRTDSFLDRLVSAGPLAARDAHDFACVRPRGARLGHRHRQPPRPALRRLWRARDSDPDRRGRDGADGGEVRRGRGGAGTDPPRARDTRRRAARGADRRVHIAGGARDRGVGTR